MLRTISNKIIFVLLLTAINYSIAQADTYVCSTDPIYKEYSLGQVSTLNGATFYASENVCKNNCRNYVGCAREDINSTATYYCPPMKYQDLGGDIGGTNFSDKTKCDAKCFIQNSCINIQKTGCRIVDIQLMDPVTDYTNKTVYTERKITYECETNETKQIGCNKWQSIVTNSNMDYNTTGAGTVWKKYKGYDEASATAYLMEQSLHIFSGWAGYCEHGLLWNNPFKDPMTILSYVMMTYTDAGKNAFGTEAKKLHDAISNKFDAIANKFKIGSSTSVLDSTKNAASLSSKLSKLNIIHTFSVPIVGKVDLLYTDILKLGLAALPTDDQYATAKDFNLAWMGQSSSADEQALAYAQCMASIGLSFPNLVSVEASDTNNTSDELKDPLSNPISLTEHQISILMNATSPKYVEKMYIPIKYNTDFGIVTYVAVTPQAYFQAGQVLCGGELAVASNIVAESNNDTQKSSTAKNVGMAAAKMFISKLCPPPYNIVASVIFDVLTSFQHGDACHSIATATKWGLIQLKTNRALSFDQCHHTGSECAAKWFWGSCMRTREKYCCYDQIVTRIFAEGLKAEMYPPGSTQMWEKCNDISIKDLKNLSFRMCDPGETPYKNKCFPPDKYDEFIQAMKTQGYKNMDMTDIANQAMNSLAIPDRSCKNCK